jgi:hypothetical protein
VVLIYDIENDRLRTRIADACMDYGLERIQFSAFFGKLNRNRRQELALNGRMNWVTSPAGSYHSGLRAGSERHVGAGSVPPRRRSAEGRSRGAGSRNRA